MRSKSLLMIPAALVVACFVGCSAEEPSAAKDPGSPTGTGSPAAATGAGGTAGAGGGGAGTSR